MRIYKEGQWVKQSKKYGSDRYGVIESNYGPNGLFLHDVPVLAWNRMRVKWNGERFSETVFSDEIQPVVINPNN